MNYNPGPAGQGDWILDTGAPLHAAGDARLFYKDSLKPPVEKIAHGVCGGRAQISHIGDVPLFVSKTDGGCERVVLKDVRYVPELRAKHMVSYAELVKDGWRLKSRSDGMSIVLRKLNGNGEGVPPKWSADNPGNGHFHVKLCNAHHPDGRPCQVS